MTPVDLRSDTCTKPTGGMRRAMADAEVGNDVYGEDPTVDALERRVAERLDKEAAVMVTSGTQGNLCAVLAHCDRGDAFVVGADYHSFDHEGGGAAALGSVHPQPVETSEDGRLPAEHLRREVGPTPGPPGPRPALVGLENPVAGRALPESAVRSPAAVADDAGLAVHLDGARLFNAARSLDTSPASLADPVDTVMVSLVKGLGAPVGALVCGPNPFVEEVRYWRKVVGGGWRQAGVLAAAGLYALDHHVERLAEDHRLAGRLADGLAGVDGVRIDLDAVETNMVFAHLEDEDPERLARELEARGIRIHPGDPVRLVTHLDVSEEGVDRAVDAFRDVLAG